MHWAVTLLSAPRPQGPTIHRTLDSLARSGWQSCLVWYDAQGRGQFRSWMAALGRAVELDPQAEVYFMVEDDVVFCRGLREYLERTLWPADPAGVAICSPYCPEAYQRVARGWHREDRGRYLVSCLSWAVPAGAARAVLAELAPLLRTGRPLRGADYLVGEWAARTGRQV
ncbi:MAG: hypothetical protein ACUVUC_14365, partial [Thermoguttaceae bacterium]